MGLGPAEDADRKSAAAIIVRQHSVGAGVVVDADGLHHAARNTDDAAQS
jgi:hypothetical protein